MLITFGQILSERGIKTLRQANIHDAERDANLLLQYMMHEDNRFIFLHRNDGTDESHADGGFSAL